MTTYKGFNKDMTCRNFQYEEGREIAISFLRYSKATVIM